MTKRFMLTIPDDDYEAIRVAAFTHGTQPAVEARNLLLAQLRASGGTGTLTAVTQHLDRPAITGAGSITAEPDGDTDQGGDIPDGLEYLRACPVFPCCLSRGHKSDHDYASIEADR